VDTSLSDFLCLKCFWADNDSKRENTMHESSSYHIGSGVAHITLNRPEKMNVLNLDLFDALVETGGTIKNDPRVQVVVMSGSGKAFCAGQDMECLEGLSSWDLNERTHGLANTFQQAAWVWHEITAPASVEDYS
jgi:enoyl-CoA hydratase/carnithine racemase